MAAVHVRPPACELWHARRKKMYQTYVIKVAGFSESVELHACSTVFDARALASATVKVRDGPFGFYFVQTLDKEYEHCAFASRMHKEVEKLPGSPRVEWVRPLTRRLQRLFGWGDVASTSADIVRATKAGDTAELVELLPQARGMIESGKLGQLPVLHDALRTNIPALEDCKHEFFQENRLRCVPCPPPDVQGPCRNGPMTLEAHRPPFTRCQSCRIVLCLQCARESEAETNDSKELQYALHEALDQHAFEPNPDARCEHCLCRTVVECRCGARRCQKCDHPEAASAARAQYTWRRHPIRPLPFYVIDQAKVPETEKLAWIKQEIGRQADLQNFATKFLDLFGDKLHGTVPQKNACIKLYSQYAPEEDDARNWEKESDIPPFEREDFQRAWGQTARLCRECAKPVPRDVTGFYCSAKCEQAACVYACRKCNKVLEDRVHPYCTDCNGSSRAPRKRPADDAFDLQTSRDSLALMQRVCHTNRQVDRDHTPAWKLRKKS